LVGRAGQLSALHTALDAASAGRPSTIMIGGEAGVGKTRLVSEFTGEARRKGARVLTGGCLELGADGLPFAPFTSVLRELVRDLGEAGKRPAEERAQQAHRLTFAAETGSADGAQAGTEPSDGDRAEAWDEAAQAWEALDEAYPLALVLLRSAEAAVAAVAAVAAGDREGGATRLRRAAALAQSLGASPLSDDIALLARRARISPDPDAGSQATPLAEPERLGLTAREFEVLRLVADGRGNREIAGELFISAKTVSVHVSNILGKLSVATRGEAAAVAHRLRLFDPKDRGSLRRPQRKDSAW
jgi:DNA-binding NarL/FixJ family response regulator